MSVKAEERTAPSGTPKIVDYALLFLGLLLIPTWWLTVPLGLTFRALRDGLLKGWEWPERNPVTNQDKLTDEAFEKALFEDTSTPDESAP